MIRKNFSLVFKAVSLLLSVLIIMSTFSLSLMSVFAAGNQTDASANNEEIVYFMTDDLSNPVYLYSWTENSGNWSDGQLVKSFAQNGRQYNFWKFNVNTAFDGVLFTKQNYWNENSDNADIKITPNDIYKNNVTTDVLYYEMIGSQTSYELSDYEYASVDSPQSGEFSVKLGENVILLDLSNITVSGTLKEYGVTADLYEGDNLIASFDGSDPDNNIVKYTASTEGVHLLTLKVRDIAGQSDEENNISFTVNVINDFVFENKQESYTFSNGLTVPLQKITKYENANYEITQGDDIAQINGDNIDIIKPGTITVCATLEDNAVYEASYTINVAKGNRSGRISFAEQNPDDITYKSNGKYTNSASYNAEDETDAVLNYKITEQSPENTAEINSVTGELTVKNAGSVTVEAYVAEDDYYGEYHLAEPCTYTVKIIPAKLSDDVKFARTQQADIPYGTVYENEIVNLDDLEGLNIEYSSSNSDIATVKADLGNVKKCIVTPVAVSDEVVTVTAKITSRNYTGSSYFDCAVTKGVLSVSTPFENGTVNEVYAEDKSLELKPFVKCGDVTLNKEDYTLSYEVSSNTDLSGNNIDEAVVTVDSTGKVKLNRSGNAQITITAVPKSNNYSEAKTVIFITVQKADDNSFKFKDIDGNYIVTYGDNNNIVKVSATSEYTDNSNVSYASSDPDVAEISEDGTITIKKAGKTTISSKKEAGDRYNESKASFVLTVNKSDRNWKYHFSEKGMYLGQSHTPLRPDGYEDGDVTYSVKPDNNSCGAVIDSNGDITVKNTGEATIVAAIAEDECYNSAEAEYKLNVSLLELPVNFSIYDCLSGSSVENNAHSFNSSVKINVGEDYQISLVNTDDDQVIFDDRLAFEDSLELKENTKNPRFVLRYVGQDEEKKNAVTDIISTDIKIDVTAPTGEIIKDDNIFTDIIKVLSFGLFGDDETEVQIKAIDESNSEFESGLKSIEYYIMSSKDRESVKVLTEEDLSSVENWETYSFNDNTGESEIIKVSDDVYTVIYVRLTDNFGNVSYISTNGIVYENTAPHIKTENPKIDGQFGYYYNDINVNVKVTDTDNDAVSSGIKSVAYKIFADGNELDSGRIYSNEKEDSSVGELNNLNFIIEVKENNYDNVYYTVTAVDNCGNEATYTSESFRVMAKPEARVIFTAYCTDNCCDLGDGYKIHNHAVTAEICLPNNEKCNDAILNDENNIYDKAIKNFYAAESISIEDDWILKDDCWVKKVTFADGKYDYSNSNLEFDGVKAVQDSSLLSFIVDTTAPEVEISFDNNSPVRESYYNGSRTATITVDDQNFVGLDGIFEITAVDSDGEELANAVPEVVWSEDGKTAKVVFSEDANYTFSCNEEKLVDLAGNKAELTYKDGTKNYDSFTVDNTKPSDMKITYKENESIFSTFAQLISKLTNGYVHFGDTVTVTVEVKDAISPIDRFVYSAPLADDAGVGSEGIDETTVAKATVDEATFDEATSDQIISNQKVLSNFIVYNKQKNTYKISFDIAPEYKGKIQVRAYDKADNYIESDENGIVVSSAKPVISIDAGEPQNTYEGISYYSGDIPISVTVEDFNFDSSKVEISEETLYNGENKTTVIDAENLTWTNIEGTNKYIAEFALSGGKANGEGLETLKVNYTNNSGHSADEAVAENMIIDRTAPNVKISFDNNFSVRESYYKGSRTATITVDDENFKGTDGMFEVNAVDGSGNKLESAVTEVVWTDDKNAEAVFSEDANYTFSCNEEKLVDLAGNRANVTYASGTKNYDSFTVDNTKPSDMKITYRENESIFSTFAQLLSKLTNGYVYFGDTVTVTVEVKDATSPIDRFVYSAPLANDAGVGSSEIERTIDRNVHFDESSGMYSVSFNIDPEYKGKIQVRAYDKADNYIESDENGIVVSSAKPVISIDAGEPQNTYEGISYYSGDIPISVTVEDFNFDSSKVEISEETLYNGENKTTVIDAENLTWTNIEGTNKYIAEFALSGGKANGEGLETLKVNYTNNSGHSADEAVADDMIIDRTAPKVIISYNSDTFKNDKYYANGRTATLTVTDDNFVGTKNMVSITAVDKNSKQIDKVPEINWENNTKGKINFSEDAYYTFNLNNETFVDLAGNKAECYYSDSALNPHEFVVDKTKPDNAKVTVKDKNGNVLGNAKTDSIVTGIVFDNYSNASVEISLQADDNLTGVNCYYYISSKELSKNEIEAVSDSLWTRYNGKFNISPDKKFVVYAKACDKSENTTYFSSDGIILDSTNPEIDGIAPQIKLNASSDKPMTDVNNNDIYNGDVVVDYTVSDPVINNTCSGLNASNLRYEITNNGVVTQQGVLDGKTENFDGHMSKMTGQIRVDSSLNNSNNVKLTVYAQDNSDNKSSEEYSLKIDITAPEISVAYSNNNADSGNYFKESRTASITVRERNFNSEEVKINITKDGQKFLPNLRWTHSGNSSSDSYTHTATIVYSDDADYTFDISYTDEAGNVCRNISYGDSVSPKDFTVDRTAPVVSVSYDNNSAQNNNYYNKQRIATITINEHNFDASRVNYNIIAEDNGKAVTAPTISAWSNSGDIHTATITYSEDAHYHFSFDYTDLAGNNSNIIRDEEFYVDTTAPEIVIKGINYKSANNGDDGNIGFTITATDTNFDSSAFKREFLQVSINGQDTNVDNIGKSRLITNGMEYTVENISDDGVYSIKCSVTDKAGNTTSEIKINNEQNKQVEEELVLFSVNRHGSTFMLDDDTKEIVETGYIKEIKNDIKIIEINPDTVNDYVLTLNKGSQKPMVLSNGDNYTRESSTNENSWSTYTYTIKASCFAEEAAYSLSLTTQDRANNKSYSTTSNPEYSDEPLAKVDFVIDRTSPEVVVTNLESNGRYNTEKQSVKIIAKDENVLDSLKIVLNGETYREYNADELAENKGEILIDIESSQSLQTMDIIAVDAANNSTDDSEDSRVHFSNFLITTNFWIQFVNNTVALIISISVILLLVAATVFIVIKKRSNNKAQ